MKRILIVDDNEKNLASLNALLVDAGYEVMSASTQATFSEGLKQENIRLVMINTSTAFVELSWVASFIREHEGHQHLPIFFISNGSADSDEAAECFAHDGNDYLQRPINTKELLGRIDFHIRQCTRLAEVELRNERLANLATYDQLTKVSSRLHMQTLLRQQIQLQERRKSDVGLIYLRIMKYSKVNTLLGYAQGDKVLYQFATTLKKLIRKSDVVGRWGGSDFVLMLPNADDDATLMLAKKINQLLITDKGLARYSLRYSLGVVQLREGETVARLIDRSRKIMEEAAERAHENILVD